MISHQLTPFLMIIGCAGLVVVGRCTPRGLPILLAVIAIGWVSFATAGYWSGHMSTIFGQIGRLGGTISASVGSHLIGTPMHQFPVYGRIVLAGIIIALAVLGLLRRWHRRVTDRALVVLLIAPVSIAALQNYGGEISLRIFLFALPAAAILAACLFFPETGAGESVAPRRGLARRPRGRRDRIAGSSSPPPLAAWWRSAWPACSCSLATAMRASSRSRAAS